MSEEAKTATQTYVAVDELGRLHLVGKVNLELSDASEIPVPKTTVDHWLEVDAVATRAAYLTVVQILTESWTHGWGYAVRVRPVHAVPAHRDPVPFVVSSDGGLSPAPSCFQGQPIALRGPFDKIFDRAFDLAVSGCTVIFTEPPSAASPASTPAPVAP